MRFDRLADWLRWQETLHPARVDLRLERVGAVWSRLGPARFPCPVITVGGTNGKGSCVAYLEGLYLAAGYRPCAYTSPHLLRYNERIRIAGCEVDDDAICGSFARIDAVRGDAPLTYFEFGTLAALDLFTRAQPDIVLLEVGLGGRLDAVNIIDPDVAVVTSIGLDHTAWLGSEREQIALEKAGIFRAGRPAVIGQRDAPARLAERALEIGASMYRLGAEFDYRIGIGQWDWLGPAGRVRHALPSPALRGRVQYDNAATALCAGSLLEDRLPLPAGSVRRALLETRLAGRFSVLPGEVALILDVAHNREAAQVLAANLADLRCAGRLHAVFSLLSDKDAAGIVAELADQVDSWHLAPAPSLRGMAVDRLADAVSAVAPDRARTCYDDLESALDAAAGATSAGDCILVFGSFVSVEVALRKRSTAPV
jgi:dihydrofolate synthase/folylpolyglutamate synthase